MTVGIFHITWRDLEYRKSDQHMGVNNRIECMNVD